MRKYLLILALLPVTACLATSSTTITPGALIDAAQAGQKDIFEKLTKEQLNGTATLSLRGPFVVCQDKDIADATPFIAACAFNHLDLAKHLVSLGADPKYTTPQGYQATHVAAFMGYPTPVVYCVTSHGLSLNTKDKEGFDVVAAARGGYIERHRECHQILDGMADVDPQAKDQLCAAIQKNYLFTVRYLVEYQDADFDRTINLGSYYPADYNGKTAYAYAQTLDCKEIVAYFEGRRKLKSQL